MNAREVTGFEAKIFWITLILFSIPKINWKNILIEWRNKK